jgi:hypothetical protein
MGGKEGKKVEQTDQGEEEVTGGVELLPVPLLSEVRHPFPERIQAHRRRLAVTSTSAGTAAALLIPLHTVHLLSLSLNFFFLIYPFSLLVGVRQQKGERGREREMGEREGGL